MLRYAGGHDLNQKDLLSFKPKEHKRLEIATIKQNWFFLKFSSSPEHLTSWQDALVINISYHDSVRPEI